LYLTNAPKLYDENPTAKAKIKEKIRHIARKESVLN
jgi:hypothetical protein